MSVQDLAQSRNVYATVLADAAADERVRRSEALLRIGSFVIDRALRAEQWSAGMYPILGVSVTDFAVTVASHLELVHPDDRSAVSDAIDAVILDGIAVELDHRLAGTDDRWVFLAVSPIVDAAGDIVGVVGACQDISGRKSAEAVKDSFLRSVSHDLRTPLTSIVGYAGLITRTHPGEEDLAKLVAPIERNGAGMLQMLDELLDGCQLR